MTKFNIKKIELFLWIILFAICCAVTIAGVKGAAYLNAGTFVFMVFIEKINNRVIRATGKKRKR